MTRTPNNRGVSPVIGVVLMVTVTVLIATIIAGVFFGIGDEYDKPVDETDELSDEVNDAYSIEQVETTEQATRIGVMIVADYEHDSLTPSEDAPVRIDLVSENGTVVEHQYVAVDTSCDGFASCDTYWFDLGSPGSVDRVAGADVTVVSEQEYYDATGEDPG